MRRGDITRGTILTAAAAEFGAKGYEGASMRSIARNCGIELGLIQYHFVDKLTLWSETLDHVVGSFSDRWTRTLTRLRGQPPEVILAQFLESLIRHAAGHPDFVAIMAHARLEGSPGVKVFQDLLRGAALVLMDLIEAAQANGAFVAGRPLFLFYDMVGAALRIFMAASDVKALGVDPRDPGCIDEHIASCTRLFILAAPAQALAPRRGSKSPTAAEPLPDRDQNWSNESGSDGPSTFYILTNVESVIRKSLDQELRALGITSAQMIALIRIADEHRLSSAGLARMLDVSAQTVTLFVRALEKQGLIVRRQAPKNQRVLEIELTPAGQRTLQKLHDVVADTERRLLDGLSTEERNALKDLLLRVLRRHRPSALTEWSPLLGRRIRS